MHLFCTQWKTRHVTAKLNVTESIVHSLQSKIPHIWHQNKLTQENV